MRPARFRLRRGRFVAGVCCGVWLLAPVAGAAPSPAPAPTPAPSLTQAIDAYLAAPQFMRADWGIAVRSLDSGELLYAHNAERLRVPASLAKLFTTGLALDRLGAGHRVRTTLYATATRVGALGILRGDLILYGRGDPSLGLADATPAWADRLAAALAQRGVRRIHGKLIVDSTYFAGPAIGSGWEAGDLQAGFGATPGAVNVLGNVVTVEVTRRPNHCCDISITPAAAGMRLYNQTSSTSPLALGLYRPAGSTTLFAVGQLPASVSQRAYTLSMPDPAHAAGVLLRDALTRRGIELSGPIEVLHWPQANPALARAGTRAIADIESPTLAQWVTHTLKESDNLFAQALLLQVGARYAGAGDCAAAVPPDTAVGWGLCALQAALADADIAADSVLLAEGSGLARRNLVTPDALVQWLAWSQNQPWAAALRDALPVAGVDGTLAWRLADGVVTDNVQAKTGTLTHAYALAGFVTNAAGERLTFAIMLEHYPRREVAATDPTAATPTQALDTIAAMIARSR